MKVAIIGQGYVGLPIALAAADSGYSVIGFDINSKIVDDLNSGISHIEDISNKKLKNHLANGTYKATIKPDDLREVVVAVIAVPTPLDEMRNPDLSYLESACLLLAKNLTKETLIINESTSYPGTLRNVISPLVSSNTTINHEFAISPERVDPGNKNWRISNTPRIVAGLSENALLKTKEFYGKFCENLISVSSPEVAEAAKIFENTFRQVNIALVNEFSHITHSLGISVREVLDAAETKPYGFMRFDPGLGVGGHCIPVDPSYLSFLARQKNQTAAFVELANSVNLNQPIKIVERIKRDIGGSLNSKNIVVVGMSYKPNITDIRESPSIILINLLRAEGANVVWNDPIVGSWKKEKSTSLTGDRFNIAILAISHNSTDLAQVQNCANYVFDCVGVIDGASQL
jgi:UDP-N-acetyl-D-glucosamine dehydrogenase